VTPVRIGRSVSPIPIPKQIATTSLDIDRPENYSIPLLSRGDMTKFDKFHFKPLKLFSFYSQLVGSIAPPGFFDSLQPVELLEYQFDPSFLIADESGLGKTVMVRVALRMLFRQAQLSCALIVC